LRLFFKKEALSFWSLCGSGQCDVGFVRPRYGFKGGRANRFSRPIAFLKAEGDAMTGPG
jgi:hypothetical protein